MPKYIDADKLLTEAKQLSGPMTGDGWSNLGVYALIERQPEVDIHNNGWILVHSRLMDEEERKEYAERIGCDVEDLDEDDAVIFTSQLPDYGQEVITCNKCGTIRIDIFFDDDDGCYFEENGDMDGIIAWMPLPKPPKECENDD